jgi:transaldolase
MKLFLDTANLADIEEALKGGFIRGITTNPSLLSKEPKGNYLKHMAKIVALAKKYGKDISLSVEVFSNEKAEMIKQSEQFVRVLNYKHLAIKIPISYKGTHNLDVMRELSRRGIRVNCTACMTPLQLMMAAASGASYVSLFYNRVKDGATEEQSAGEREALLKNKQIEQGHFDPDAVLLETRALLSDYPKAEIIVGSIRSPVDVMRAGAAGGHIVTASLKILKDSLMHFKTDHSIDGFLKDFESWMK